MMKKLLLAFCFVTAFLLIGYPKPKPKPSWTEGEIVAQGGSIYRKFLGINEQGYYQVQDFYKRGDTKRTDPYLLMQAEFVDRTKFADVVFTDRKIHGSYVLWLPTGEKVKEGFYLYGVKQGLWTQWYANGQKNIEGIYQDGWEQGQWTWWYDNGRKREEGIYENGKRQGRWVGWYTNGEKLDEGNYQGGKRQGLWTWWHSNGQINLEVSYEGGEISGALVKWLENGEKEFEGELQSPSVQELVRAPENTAISSNMLAVPPWKAGEIVAEGEIECYVADREQNWSCPLYRKFLNVDESGYYWVQDFYKQGDMKFTDPYLLKFIEDVNKGEFTPRLASVMGEYTRWHRNGQKWEERYYQNASFQGLTIEWWYSSSQKREEEFFFNGTLEGRWLWWHENGQKARVAQRIHGSLEGPWVEWHNNGQQSSEGYFQNNKPQGLWTYWSANGKKISEQWRMDGKN